MQLLAIAFIILFVILFLAPMLGLLITVGIEIRKIKKHMRETDREIKRIINSM